VLTTQEVAALLGVKRKTIRQYRSESKKGRSYADHPFPAPWRYVGRSPVWLDSQIPDIKEWAQTRIGQGKGGGRPWPTA